MPPCRSQDQSLALERSLHVRKQRAQFASNQTGGLPYEMHINYEITQIDSEHTARGLPEKRIAEPGGVRQAND